MGFFRRYSQEVQGRLAVGLMLFRFMLLSFNLSVPFDKLTQNSKHYLQGRPRDGTASPPPFILYIYNIVISVILTGWRTVIGGNRGRETQPPKYPISLLKNSQLFSKVGSKTPFPHSH